MDDVVAGAQADPEALNRRLRTLSRNMITTFGAMIAADTPIGATR
jgi:hypothetical protein